MAEAERRGRYIALEGIVGNGKSSQAPLLTDRLRVHIRREVGLFREPGSTEVAEAIRSLVQGTLFVNEEMTARCESLLYAAARTQLVIPVIYPLLSRGGWAVTDRCFVSNLAIQGVVKKLGIGEVEGINYYAIRSVRPDLVVVIDTPVKLALSRAADQRGDKFENMPVKFWSEVRAAYLYVASIYPGLVNVIDGDGDVQTVSDRVWGVVCTELKDFLPGGSAYE